MAFIIFIVLTILAITVPSLVYVWVSERARVSRELEELIIAAAERTPPPWAAQLTYRDYQWFDWMGATSVTQHAKHNIPRDHELARAEHLERFPHKPEPDPRILAAIEDAFATVNRYQHPSRYATRYDQYAYRRARALPRAPKPDAKAPTPTQTAKADYADNLKHQLIHEPLTGLVPMGHSVKTHEIRNYAGDVVRLEHTIVPDDHVVVSDKIHLNH